MKNKGFTLLEVMIVVVLLSLVLASAGMLLEAGIIRWERITGRTELNHNLQVSLSRMIDEIKGAQEVVAGSTANELTIKISDAENITYGLKDDPNIDEHPYNLNGQELYRQVNGGDRIPQANFIYELVFEYNATPVEDSTFISIKVKGFLPDGEEYNLESGAELKWKSFASMTE